MPNFVGALNSNEIFASLYNMIISQEVFANNISSSNELVDKARVDGGLFGDTKTYTSTDVLRSREWTNDAEANSLLQLDRPVPPETQAIVIDQFRQISLTVDNYLSKRAWSTERAFSDFNGVLLGWISVTKRIYDTTNYNAFVGTDVSTTGLQSQNFEIVLGGTTEQNILRGQQIAEKLANLLVDMTKRPSRDYNDYGFLRKYSMEDIQIVWNSKYYNEIQKFVLPVLFHNENLIDKLGQNILHSQYFGTVKAAGGTSTGTERSLIEYDYNTVAQSAPSYDPALHVFPGDLIPSGKQIKAHEAYDPDDKVICKIFVKLPPYMSAFEVGTSFFNPRSLTENHYLTFSHNTLEHLSNYPVVTIKETNPA